MCVCVCVCYLHVLYSAWLSLTQHVEQQQDQVLDVLQRLLLGNQVRMHLVQHLHNTQTQINTHLCRSPEHSVLACEHREAVQHVDHGSHHVT